jgi:hypothetical protein
VLAVACGNNFNPPAFRSRITLIHAKQVTGKNGRFIAARTRSHFQNDVTLVSGIPWQQQNADGMLKLLNLAIKADTLCLGHCCQFTTGFQHVFYVMPFPIGLLQVLRRLGRGLKLRIFLGQFYEHISGRARGKLMLDIGKPVDDPVKFLNLN